MSDEKDIDDHKMDGFFGGINVPPWPFTRDPPYPFKIVLVGGYEDTEEQT